MCLNILWRIFLNYAWDENGGQGATSPVVLKVGRNALRGDFEGQGGEQNKGAVGGKNAQPPALIDHWVTIIELTLAVTLILSKQRNRLLILKQGDLRLCLN